MGQHAKLAPSAAHRWIACPGSIQRCADFPETSSEYADEGTAAHELAAWALREGKAARDYLGAKVPVMDGEGNVRRTFEVDEDMADFVQVYLDAITRATGDDELLVEQRLDISPYLGVEGQFGTGDAIILRPGMLEVHDLKFGRGERVNAYNNAQLMCYALGALHEFGLLVEFEQVKMAIHQPRLDHYDEWIIDVNELEFWAEHTAAPAAQEALSDNPTIQPGEKQCRWCPYKPYCPEAADMVQNTVMDDFSELTGKGVNEPAVPDSDTPADQLSENLELVDFVREWVKAVEEEAKNRLNSGQPVPGYKLVQGRAGNRQWSNEDEVSKQLKKFRFKNDDIYTRKLVSPAQAEKLLKGQPKRWEKVADFITRGTPSLKIVPESDDRPAIAQSDDFSDLTGGSNDG